MTEAPVMKCCTPGDCSLRAEWEITEQRPRNQTQAEKLEYVPRTTFSCDHHLGGVTRGFTEHFGLGTVFISEYEAGE